MHCGHNDNQGAHAKEPRATNETSERRAENDAPRSDVPRNAAPRNDARRNAAPKTERPEPSSVAVQSIQAPPSRASLPPAVSARCDATTWARKQKYPTRAECVMLMQDDKRDEINEKDCPGGLDKKQLNACLVAIRDESCGNPLDAINRLVACRASSICLK